MILNDEQLKSINRNTQREPLLVPRGGRDHVYAKIGDLLDTIADLKRQLAERDRVRERCLITGNLCGTDTQADGRPCMCNNCRALDAYVQEKVAPLKARIEQLEIIRDNHDPEWCDIRLQNAVNAAVLAEHDITCPFCGKIKCGLHADNRCKHGAELAANRVKAEAGNKYDHFHEENAWGVCRICAQRASGDKSEASG